MDHRYETYRNEVRRAHPEAKIRPHGATLVAVFVGDEQLGRPFSTPERAWLDACHIVRANAAS